MISGNNQENISKNRAAMTFSFEFMDFSLYTDAALHLL
jgi:hypothetical protein